MIAIPLCETMWMIQRQQSTCPHFEELNGLEFISHRQANLSVNETQKESACQEIYPLFHAQILVNESSTEGTS